MPEYLPKRGDLSRNVQKCPEIIEQLPAPMIRNIPAPPWSNRDHIESFLAVVAEDGFCKAAIALNACQPSISRRIKELEDFLGAPLFTRRKGISGPVLTDLGWRFYQRVAPLWRQVQTNQYAWTEIESADVLHRLALLEKCGGSMSATARELHLTPSAISLSLRGIRKLGLIKLSGKRWLITEAGRKAIAESLELFAELSRTEDAIKRFVAGEETAPATRPPERISLVLPGDLLDRIEAVSAERGERAEIWIESALRLAEMGQRKIG